MALERLRWRWAPWSAQLDWASCGDMSCVQVNDQGYAAVTWNQAADPAGDFEQYVLHLYEPSAGLVLETYSIPDPTDPAAPAFVNTTYSAETTELCYFVVTEGPAGVFGPSSDTLCSIHLTADLVNARAGRPELQQPPHRHEWRALPEPLAVEFLDADGNWLQINSIADNGGMMTAQYALQECEGDLSFRVTQPTQRRLLHVSNVAGSQLSDELDPDPGHHGGASGLCLQEAVVTWEPSGADDLAGYIIYLCNGGFQMAIDTIYDPAVTWYIDMNSNVQSYIESYNVAAFDECFINGEPDPGAASPYCASSLF